MNDDVNTMIVKLKNMVADQDKSYYKSTDGRLNSRLEEVKSRECVSWLRIVDF